MTKQEAQSYIEEIADRQDIYIVSYHDFHCEGCGRVAERLFVRWLLDEDRNSEMIELCGGCAMLHDKIERYGVVEQL